MNTLPVIFRGLVLLCLCLALVTQAQVLNLSNALPGQQVVTAGRSVSFLATGATGSVQWQVSTTGAEPWTNLNDDATYHGATTISLEIGSVPADWPPHYYRFTSTSGSVVTASNAAKLVVSPLLLPSPAGIIVDRVGGLLVSDTTNQTIREVSSAQSYDGGYRGPCSTSLFAGVPNQAGFNSLDSVDLEGTYFNQPNGLIAAAPGVPITTVGVYVADSANGVIRLLKDYVSKLQAGSNADRGNVDNTGRLARFGTPMGLAQAADGTFLVTDSTTHTIRKMTTAGVVTTLAGSPGNAGWTDGSGGAARFNGPTGIAVDSAGMTYVADTLNNVIRKVTPAGDVTTLAGLAGVAGAQDGTGAQALFNGPTGLAIGPSHELFVADTGNSTIRVIVTTDGSVTTYAGIPTVSGLREGKVTVHGSLSNNENNYSIDALFNHPMALTVGAGVIFVADTGNAAIRVVDIDTDYRDATGTTTLLLAEGTAPPPSTNPPTTVPGSTPSATSSAPSSGGGGAVGGEFIAALAGLGLLRFGRRSLIEKSRRAIGAILLIMAAGVNETFGQDPSAHDFFVLPDRQSVTEGRDVSFSAGGTPGAIQWQISTGYYAPFTDLPEGGIYAGTKTSTLEIVGTPGAIGNSYIRFTSTVGGVTKRSNRCYFTVSPAIFPRPVGIATDGAGHFFISDEVTHTVYQGALVPVDISYLGLPMHLTLTPLAGRSGQTGSADGTGSEALFNLPAGMAVSPAGRVALADSANGTIREISAVGVVSTLAGDSANRGNIDGVGAAARFSGPLGIARTSDGTYYVADSDNHTIRKVTADGTVTTFAGSPGNAGTADGGGNAARFNHPEGVAVDGFGTVYVADTGNNLIRKITVDGIVSTLAGIPGVAGAEDGSRTQATFNAPSGIAVSGNGQMIFVADTGNSTVRLLSAWRNYEVTVYAGMPSVSGMSDGLLDHPKGVAVDASTDYYLINVYIADTGNAAIRVASWGNGLETILLGEGLTTTTVPQPVAPPPIVTPAPTVTAPTTTATTTPASSAPASGGGAFDGGLVGIFAGLWLLRKLAVARRRAAG